MKPLKRDVRPIPIPKLEDVALAYSQLLEEFDKPAQYVLINPSIWYAFRLRELSLYGLFDPETQRKLINLGIVGYLWGATVILDKKVPKGHIWVSGENRDAIDESQFNIDALVQDVEQSKSATIDVSVGSGEVLC